MKLDLHEWQRIQRDALMRELLDIEIACSRIVIVDGRATCGQTQSQVNDLFRERNMLRRSMISLKCECTNGDLRHGKRCTAEADRIARTALARVKAGA